MDFGDEKSIFEFLRDYYAPNAEETSAFPVLRNLLSRSVAAESNAEIDAILEKLSSGYERPLPALPDEEKYYENIVVRKASGGEDGMSRFHVMPDEEQANETARTIYDTVRRMNLNLALDTNSFFDDYERLKNITLVHYEDEGETNYYRTSVISFAFSLMRDFLEEGKKLSQDTRESFYELGRFLAVRAPDRVAVKIGLLLMASLPNIDKSDEDFDRALILGRHDEFTWYAGRFLYQSLDNPLAQLWELAIAAKGWGRIFAVYAMKILLEQLAAPAPDALSRWLLTVGCENDVLPEYTAGTIAEMARLEEKLNENEADEKLLGGAEIILKSIVEGGAVTIDFGASDDYRRMFERYRYHASKTPGRRAEFSDDFIPR